MIVKYRLTPQPHDNVTTPSLTGISVELRNCLSVLVPDLTERGTSTLHPVPRPKWSQVASPTLWPTDVYLVFT